MNMKRPLLRLRIALMCALALIFHVPAAFSEMLPAYQEVRPDEFLVIPARPLEASSYGTNRLPTPTPGGRNRTDVRPVRGAISVLGGAFERGIDAREDAALMASVRAFGIDDQARQEVLFAFNSASVSRGVGKKLDAYAEAQRFQRLGLQTPSAPPQ